MGRILQKLQKLNLVDDTLVIYTADHGWNAGHHGVWGKGNGTIPLNMYEESLRVPLIWNHPGHIAPGGAIQGLVSSYDFFHTILDYVGIEVPKSSRRVGRSYLPLLRGQKTSWRDRLYFEYACMRAVRTERFKYIERTDNWPSELYDLVNDPHETRNVIDNSEYRSTREHLRHDLASYFHAAGAPPLSEWRSTTVQHLPSETQLMGPSAVLQGSGLAVSKTP